MLAYTGRGLFVVSPLNLSDLVSENAQLLKSAVSRSVTLDLRLDRELPLVRADLAQFQQVVLNLLTNASEAIGDAPGVVDDRDRRGRLRSVSTSAAASSTEAGAGPLRLGGGFRTGAGIDGQTRQRMFVPFFSTKFTGRGLGLSAVLGIVKGDGGALMVDSEVGRGTTVRSPAPGGGHGVVRRDRNGAVVTAPVEPRPGAALGGRLPESPGAPGTGPERPSLLVVDDDAGCALLASDALGEAGFAVETAADGEAALSAPGNLPARPHPPRRAPPRD